MEREWLDRFSAEIPSGGTVLDLGCGTGEPIARYLIGQGYKVVGLDLSASMLAFCRSRFPEAEWMQADMRELSLGRSFDGIVAWDSFFHLEADDQRMMFARFASHCLPGAPLLFTSGPEAGESIGQWFDEPLYHASLDEAEYQSLLEANGFEVRAHRVEDPACGGHTIWLAKWLGR